MKSSKIFIANSPSKVPSKKEQLYILSGLQGRLRLLLQKRLQHSFLSSERCLKK